VRDRRAWRQLRPRSPHPRIALRAPSVGEVKRWTQSFQASIPPTARPLRLIRLAELLRATRKPGLAVLRREGSRIVAAVRRHEAAHGPHQALVQDRVAARSRGGKGVEIALLARRCGRLRSAPRSSFAAAGARARGRRGASERRRSRCVGCRGRLSDDRRREAIPAGRRACGGRRDEQETEGQFLHIPHRSELIASAGALQLPAIGQTSGLAGAARVGGRRGIGAERP
jgi:hypothetical protein